MKDFDAFVSKHKNSYVSVTKLKNLRNSPKDYSEIYVGESFIGQLSLHYVDPWDTNSGFTLMLNGGWTFRSSIVREVVQKGSKKWLCKTMNSVYRVMVEE